MEIKTHNQIIQEGRKKRSLMKNKEISPKDWKEFIDKEWISLESLNKYFGYDVVAEYKAELSSNNTKGKKW